MIVCAKCGNANDARDEFCGSCGAFLEWHGEKVAEAPREPEPVPVPQQPERPTFKERVRYAVGLDDQIPGPHGPPPVGPPNAHGAGHGAPPIQRDAPPPIGPPPHVNTPPPFVNTPPPFVNRPPVSPPARPPVPPAPPVRPPAPPPVLPPVNPWPPQPDEARRPQPPADPGQPARRPDQEFQRPNAQRRATDSGPSDQFCGSCGAGNVADRRFCRSCGTSLDDAVVVRLPWWKRMFGAGAPTRRGGLASGGRPNNWKRLSVNGAENDGSGGGNPPKRKRRMPRLPDRIPIGRFLGVILAVAGLVGMGVPAARLKVTEWGFNTYHSAMRIVKPEHVVVAAKVAESNSQVNGRVAADAVDQNPDTYWSEALPTPGEGAELRIAFDKPTDVSKIGFYNGAAGKEYTAQPRLKTVEVSYFDKERTRTLKKQITVADTEKRQDLDLEGKDVASVSVKIIDVYAGQKGTAASVREVVFWTVK